MFVCVCVCVCVYVCVCVCVRGEMYMRKICERGDIASKCCTFLDARGVTLEVLCKTLIQIVETQFVATVGSEH